MLSLDTHIHILAVRRELRRRTLWEYGSRVYGKEEFARRGQTIYEQQVRPEVEEGNLGRIVAIDIETGRV